MTEIPQPKLFMLLLGSKAPERNVEQHDYFFGIATNLKALIPHIKAFWPEAGASIHIDGWREVNAVNGYEVKIVPRSETNETNKHKLFFINLGGYQSNKLEEQHYAILTVQSDRAKAVQDAKKTIFFKQNTIKGATSHIDDKYGIDVDDIHHVDEILVVDQKKHYQLQITPAENLPEDEIHLGYFKLDKL